MRNSFANQITSIAAGDSSVRLLVGDIGFRIFDDFVTQNSTSFINCGIAEQNMVSCAAGMASEGLKVFVYTITPFLTMRAYEQIRVDVGINKANIILVGVGAGLAYDKLGPTHHAYEDLALMRSIPNQVVYTPYDGPSTAEATLLAYNSLSSHSSYIRLSKGGEPSISNPTIVRPQIHKWRSSTTPDFTIVTHGSILNRFVNSDNSERKYEVIALNDLSSGTSSHLINYLLGPENPSRNLVFCEESFSVGSFTSSFLSTYISELSSFNIKQHFLPHNYVYDVLDRDSLLLQFGFTPEALSSLFL